MSSADDNGERGLKPSRDGPRLVSGERLRIPQGSLYPALHRLENKALLKSEWMPTATGREAKFYRLTPKGRKQLEVEVAVAAGLSASPECQYLCLR